MNELFARMEPHQRELVETYLELRLDTLRIANDTAPNVEATRGAIAEVKRMLADLDFALLDRQTVAAPTKFA